MIHIEIAAEKLFYLLGVPITNTLITSWIVIAVLLIGSFILHKKIKLVPDVLQNIFENLLEAFLDIMEGMFGSRETAEKYAPIIITVFLFVLTSNWLGIFPGFGSIGFFEIGEQSKTFIPLFRSAASDLNFTLALAVVVVLSANVLGAAAIGTTKHLSKFFSFRNPIHLFIGILELISEFAKMVSFSFRLFGNIFAGEVLLVITSFLVPYLVPVPFLILEIFVGFIQALIFAMLTMVFTSIAVAHH